MAILRPAALLLVSLLVVVAIADGRRLTVAHERFNFHGGTYVCQFQCAELLSWCLRRPFQDRLTASSSTLVTLESAEAFGLEAADVKYVTQHFRYTFTNEKVRRRARYYSPGWRTWAAVAVQLAWRRYKHRKTLASLSFIRPHRPLSRCSSLGQGKLRLYTALLTSPKPNQDDLL